METVKWRCATAASLNNNNVNKIFSNIKLMRKQISTKLFAFETRAPSKLCPPSPSYFQLFCENKYQKWNRNWDENNATNRQHVTFQFFHWYRMLVNKLLDIDMTWQTPSMMLVPYTSALDPGWGECETKCVIFCKIEYQSWIEMLSPIHCHQGRITGRYQHIRALGHACVYLGVGVLPAWNAVSIFHYLRRIALLERIFPGVKGFVELNSSDTWPIEENKTIRYDMCVF